METFIKVLVQKKAAQRGVDPALLLAMVATESSGVPAATRYEPHTAKYLVDAARYAKLAGISLEDEQRQQMTSWGLMQVMGYVARELGFKGRIAELGEKADLGLIYGIDKLRRIESMFLGQVSVVLTWNEALVAAYNHGHPHKLADGKWFNEDYVRTVERHYLKFKGGAAA